MASRAMPGLLVATLTAGFVLLLVSAPGAEARMAIACSPFVYPCHCGLCPVIVDCKTKVSAECFCGTAQPGIYPHPQDRTKFWMCSYDSMANVRYGVEVLCPARLLFDPVVKVCTFPAAVAQPTALPPSRAAAAAPSTKPAAVAPASNAKATVAAGKAPAATEAAAAARPVAVERAPAPHKP